jgi:acetyl esterase/lipase
MMRGRWWLLTSFGLAAAAGSARRRRRLQAVSPELRSPRLLVPMSVRNGIALKYGRKALGLATPLREGVVMRERWAPGPQGAPEVRVLTYQRADRSGPTGALLWIHGGGLVMGIAEQDHATCSRFADELGIMVVSVDYRLAPEHPFPAGLDDCFAALRWMHTMATDLDIDPSRIAVGGGSAGGGLAACVAQMAVDHGDTPVCFQLLQYPMLDDRTALRRDVDALVWSAGSNRFAWGAYLGHPVQIEEVRPYASAARRIDMAGLPPAWIGVGSIDLFHDEDVEYARRLQEGGVPCELHIEPGMYHAAELFAPGSAAMAGFSQRMCDALGAAVGAATR